MPGNWHVRFGGGPYGKGPANCGHLAVRPTQLSASQAGHARSRTAQSRFAVPSQLGAVSPGVSSGLHALLLWGANDAW